MKVMTVFGTRPEAIKMAPVVLELKQRLNIEPVVVVTAQHREMLDQALEIFKIEVDYDLDIMRQNQQIVEITERVMRKLDIVIKEEKPDLVLVHGDTTTTFAAALIAFYNQVKVGHVEAGLRTYNKYSPYPEEMNRQLTGVIADFHFAPTNTAALNLINEGKKSNSVFVTGNTVIDALRFTVKNRYSHEILEQAKINGRKIVMLTTHRRENLGKPMESIFAAIKRLVQTHEDIEVVFPVHLNPTIKLIAEELLSQLNRVHLINPLDVQDFHNFMANSYLILTDSGGVQEEAPSLGVPVLVLRDTTERPEGVEAGTLKLVGVNEDDIFDATHHLLSDKVEYNKMSQATNPYGDGYAASKIVDIIIKEFNLN